MTTHRGEYVLRLGRRPLHTALFSPERSASADDWIGTPRSDEELKKMVEETIRIVEDVGGKVCGVSGFLFICVNRRFVQVSTLYSSPEPTPRTSLLLRLPPPEVSLVAEVRVAVVGNVDSGKSTTLGVLTRGMVPLKLIV